VAGDYDLIVVGGSAAGLAYLTNENIFELDALPASLAVLGGGAVGCELAQAFGRLGAAVTVVEAAPRLLPAADPATSKLTGEIFAREGITVRTGTAVEKINNMPNGPGFTLHLHDTPPVVAAHLLVAAGRTPVTDDLGLDQAGRSPSPSGPAS